MKKLIAILITIFVLAGCGTINQTALETKPTPTPEVTATPTATPEPTPTPEVVKKYVISDALASKAIKGNMIKDTSTRSVSVYLPPSYYEDTTRRYPVVYHLHGHGEPTGAVIRKNKDMTQQMKDGTSMEFIAVETDCSSMLGGSFYANSPVTGNFEDYIVNELVAYMDSTYRTIPNASARGISGFSMGGFGAMYLGFRHPNVFSAILAFGPGLFDQNGVKTAINVWDNNFEANYGAVFSPDVNLPHPYARIPKFDGSEADNQIIADWYNGFGNWEDKIKTYLAGSDKLTAVKIIYGTGDSYPFIPAGSEYVQKLLVDNGIPSELETFEGGHVLPPNFITEEFLPYFTQHLKAE